MNQLVVGYRPAEIDPASRERGVPDTVKPPEVSPADSPKNCGTAENDNVAKQESS